MLHLKRIFSAVAFCGLLLVGSGAHAEEVKADVFMATDAGPGAKVGTVTITDMASKGGISDVHPGVVVVTDLAGLPPGLHGFHIHEKGDCSPVVKDGKAGPAMAAGGHYDPEKTGKHLGPDKGGHKGDLPVLSVGPDGKAKEKFTIKDLTAKEVKGRAVMIHAGGDNYSDEPLPLGGGGARIACGVFK